MNQTWTDRRPFALSYTHTETLTAVGLKHSFGMSEAITETNISVSTSSQFQQIQTFSLVIF